VCGDQIVGQIANPPDPIINAQREGVVRNASRTRTSYRTRRSGETAARWFLIRLLALLWQIFRGHGIPKSLFL
jgi:hypothetical protein